MQSRMKYKYIFIKTFAKKRVNSESNEIRCLHFICVKKTSNYILIGKYAFFCEIFFHTN